MHARQGMRRTYTHDCSDNADRGSPASDAWLKVGNEKVWLTADTGRPLYRLVVVAVRAGHELFPLLGARAATLGK